MPSPAELHSIREQQRWLEQQQRAALEAEQAWWNSLTPAERDAHQRAAAERERAAEAAAAEAAAAERAVVEARERAHRDKIAANRRRFGDGTAARAELARLRHTRRMWYPRVPGSFWLWAVVLVGIVSGSHGQYHVFLDPRTDTPTLRGWVTCAIGGVVAVVTVVAVVGSAWDRRRQALARARGERITELESRLGCGDQTCRDSACLRARS